MRAFRLIWRRVADPRADRPLAAIVVAALGLVASGCARAPSEPLRVGINASPGHELLYLAAAKGLFAAEGARVRLVEFASPSDARRAYERGQIDGMASTLVELLQARDHSSRSPRAVLILDSSQGADALVAGSVVHGIEDLRGRSIAIEPGSVGVFLLGRALESVGASLDDVTLVPMDQERMPAAFAQHRIDAAACSSPIAHRLVSEHDGRTLFTSAAIPGEIFDVLALDEQVHGTRRDEVRAMLRAFHRAIEYAAAHPDEATRLMAARERISPAAFAEALRDEIRVPREAEQAVLLAAAGPAEQSIQHVDRMLRATGQIDGDDRTAGCIVAPPLATAKVD
jgi:NitT/TauT family transport system substrate-binding protein